MTIVFINKALKKCKDNDKVVRLFWFCLTYPAQLMLLAVSVVPRLPGVSIEMKSSTVSTLSSFGFRLSDSPVAGRKEIPFGSDLSCTQRQKSGHYQHSRCFHGRIVNPDPRSWGLVASESDPRSRKPPRSARALFRTVVTDDQLKDRRDETGNLTRVHRIMESHNNACTWSWSGLLWAEPLHEPVLITEM